VREPLFANIGYQISIDDPEIWASAQARSLACPTALQIGIEAPSRPFIMLKRLGDYLS
jgi:hypothetical protein